MTSYDLTASDGAGDYQESAEGIGEILPVESGARGFELETEGQIADSITALEDIPEIKPDQWENLSADERLNTLQSVESRMAEIQNRPPVPVEALPMGPNEFGGYDGSAIRINNEHLNGGQPVDENLDTIIHEGRHAYQEFIVAHPDAAPDPEIAQAWADNFNNYLDIQTYGAELYNDQPIERDAWSYASSIRNGIYER